MMMQVSTVARPISTSFIFFFQAEDGIRDWSVTGVQTCALPICAAATPSAAATAAADVPAIPDVTGPLKLELATLKKLYAANAALIIDAREAEERSEERRVGKEWRARWWACR